MCACRPSLSDEWCKYVKCSEDCYSEIVKNVPHKIVLVCRSCMDRQQCMYLVNNDKQATSLLQYIPCIMVGSCM